MGYPYINIRIFCSPLLNGILIQFNCGLVNGWNPGTTHTNPKINKSKVWFTELVPLYQFLQKYVDVYLANRKKNKYYIPQFPVYVQMIRWLKLKTSATRFETQERRWLAKLDGGKKSEKIVYVSCNFLG